MGVDEGELQVQLTKAEDGATWASAIAGARGLCQLCRTKFCLLTWAVDEGQPGPARLQVRRVHAACGAGEAGAAVSCLSHRLRLPLWCAGRELRGDEQAAKCQLQS